MKVETSPTLGFSVVVVLLLCITFLGLTSIASLKDGAELIVNDRYPKMPLLANMKDELNTPARMQHASLLMKTTPKSTNRSSR